MRRSKEMAREEAGRLLWRYTSRAVTKEDRPHPEPTPADLEALVKKAEKKAAALAAALVVACLMGRNVEATQLARQIIIELET